MSAEDDNDEDVWLPPFKSRVAGARIPPDVLTNIIAFARKTWRDDGAEGAFVHRLCDELETRMHEHRMSTPSIQNLKEGVGFRYVMGIDHALDDRDGVRIDDCTVTIVLERFYGGERRIVGMKFLDRMRPLDPIQHYAIVMKGWNCEACGVFVSEEKETLIVCRSCGGPRKL